MKLLPRFFWAPLYGGVLLVGCAGGMVTSGPAPDPLVRSVDSQMEALVSANQFSGAVALARHGEVLYQRGFGYANRESGLAFTPATPADGGSLAKTFTAAAIWLLVHEGKVDPNSPVRKYVPEYPHATTTIRHLLAHSNALPDYGFFEQHLNPGEAMTTARLLQIVAREMPQPAFSPGSRYEYSNLGYDTLGLVIERVSGSGYEAFMRERFFARLGMVSAFARPAEFADWRGTRTMGYRWNGDAWELHDVRDHEGFLGGSNLYFSVMDLLHWGMAQASGDALAEEVRRPGEAPSRVASGPLGVNGLSWYCDVGGRRCNYTGHNEGFHDFLYWDRDRGEVVAFVSNSTMPAAAMSLLQRNLVALLAGKPPDLPETARRLRVTRSNAAALAGTYAPSDGEPLTVFFSGDGLFLQVGKGVQYGMFPADVTREILYVPGLDYWVSFGGDPPRHLHVASQEFKMVATRIDTSVGEK